MLYDETGCEDYVQEWPGQRSLYVRWCCPCALPLRLAARMHTV